MTHVFSESLFRTHAHKKLPHLDFLSNYFQPSANLLTFCAFVFVFFAFIEMPNAWADAVDDDLNARWTTQNIPAQSGERVFSASNRFETSLIFGVVVTDDYYTYFPLSIDVGYRFGEMWGISLRGTLLMIHADTALSDFMDEHQSGIASEMLSDEQRGEIYAAATFHPVFGKWTAGAQNLGRFDWGISAGIGAVFSKTPNGDYSKRDLRAYAEGILGTDAHFFVLPWLALRLEATLRFYKTPRQWVVPAALAVGVSFFLPEIEVSK